MSDVRVNRPHQGARYNNETEAQIIRAAEKLYNAGQYKKAIERISPIYYSALRAGKASKLPNRVLRLFFPMPPEYLKDVVENLPENVKKQPPEKIAEFMLLQFSMIRQESVLDPYAHNRKSGARGLGQIRPDTASWFAWIRFKMRSFNLYKPGDNIKIMAGYIDYLLKKRHGNRDLAVASYNAGPNKIGRYIEQHNGHLEISHIKKHNGEAGRYVEIVNKNFGNYNSLYGHKVMLIAKGRSTAEHVPQAKGKAISAMAQATKPKIIHVAVKKKEEIIKLATVQAKISIKVNVASFSTIEAAKIFKKEKGFRDANISKVVVNDKIFFRVNVGFKDEMLADAFIERVKKLGISGAWKSV